jgi:DNA-directed RNA polymerase specialized sigma24 family protein
LKYLNDLKESEISKMLKIPVSTVKSRLFVARARLREILKDLKGEEGGL